MAKNYELTEKEHYVIQCLIQRFNDQESMAYMKSKGYELNSRFALYRIKKRLQRNADERLNFIAQRGYVEQHLERIAQLELVQTELWREYRTSQSRMERVIILEKIAALQPYISSYYESTQEVFEKQVNEINIPTKSNSI